MWNEQWNGSWTVTHVNSRAPALLFAKDGRGPACRWSPRWCAVWSDQKTPAYSYPREHWALLNSSTRWIRRSSAAAALRSSVVPRMGASTPTMLAYNAIDIKTICCTQNPIYNPEIFSKMTVVPLRICGSWSVRWAEWRLGLCSARHRPDRCCRDLVALRRVARSTRRCRVPSWTLTGRIRDRSAPNMQPDERTCWFCQHSSTSWATADRTRTSAGSWGRCSSAQPECSAGGLQVPSFSELMYNGKII